MQTHTSSADNSDAVPTSLATVGATAINEALFALRRAGYRIVKLREAEIPWKGSYDDPDPWWIMEELT